MRLAFGELKALVRQWERSNLFTRAASIRYHHRKHGGGSTVAAYLRAADRFPRGHAKCRVRSDTILFTHRDGRFLIVRTGTQLIVSYGSNG